VGRKADVTPVRATMVAMSAFGIIALLLTG